MDLKGMSFCLFIVNQWILSKIRDVYVIYLYNMKLC